MIPKPKRYENGKYLAYLRTLPCTICAQEAHHAHHLRTRGAGGSDLSAIPLCVTHHVEIHKIGIHSMERKYEQDWDLIRLALMEKFIEGAT